MAAVDRFDTRYELKQTYSELFLPELRSWVQMHPAGFREAYPPRWVNSIYFDTPDLHSLTTILLVSRYAGNYGIDGMVITCALRRMARWKLKINLRQQVGN